MRNIDIFKETLAVIKKGHYKFDGKEISLKLNSNEISDAIILSDKAFNSLLGRIKQLNNKTEQRCKYIISKTNSFDAAIKLTNTINVKNNSDRVLVLNFANPIHPGGGVRVGAKAQEEDLCRRSTLIASLESKSAEAMYKYNLENNSLTSSDYMILSPNVEIIRNSNYEFLKESTIVSVLSSPAPIASDGTYGLPIGDYNKIAYNRIKRILYASAVFGYKYLVLGAWGCGAFGNDARTFSKFFYDALCEMNANNIFKTVEFAILSSSANQYNFNCFKEQFADLV